MFFAVSSKKKRGNFVQDLTNIVQDLYQVKKFGNVVFMKDFFKVSANLEKNLPYCPYFP